MEPAAEPAIAVAVGTEIAPVVETVAPIEPAPTRVEEVARAVLDRVEHRDRDRGDRGDRKARRDRRTEPTAETREFWETWAEEKSARATEPKAEDAEPARGKDSPPPAVTEAAAEAPAEEAAETEPGERRSRPERGRDRDKGRSRSDTKPDRHGKDRHGKAERPGKAERTERPGKAERAEHHDKPERGERHAKAERHDDKAERSPRGKRDTAVTPAATDGAQARLFVSLGKKHGVSADDLRALLSAPIGGDRSRIGSVSLRDSHAHVRVPEEYADAIIAGVHGTQHRDQDITVERARV